MRLNARMDQAGPSQIVNTASEVIIDHGDEQHHADAMGAVIFENEMESGYFGGSTLWSLVIHTSDPNLFQGPSSNIFFLRAIGQVMLQASNFTLSSASANQDSLAPSRRVSIPSAAACVHRSSTAHAENPSDALTSIDEDKIIDSFFTNTGYLFPYIHEGRFRSKLDSLRGYPSRQRPRSWLGLLNIILAIAISADRSNGLDALQRSKKSQVYAQRALFHCKNRMMQGVNIETAHFLLLLGQYLQGTQKPSEAWTVSGLAVKVVLQLGLHTNAISIGLSAVDQEIRKRTWLACVSLDRTMSMTFGRPSSIPGSYVKVPTPLQYPESAPSESATAVTEQKDPSNVSFFAATVKLYNVVFVILDRLYGQNLEFDDPLPSRDVITRIFEIEGSLLDWEQSVPKTLATISANDLTDYLQAQGMTDVAEQRLKLRTILTLRYLSARLLLHRPILLRMLQDMSRSNTITSDNALLEQFGASSISASLVNATDIIELVRTATTSPSAAQRDVLGAWWFTLYYTFNAALTVFACYLICRTSTTNPGALDYITTLDRINAAIQSLEALDRNNQTVDRCRHCLRTLVDATMHMGQNLDQEYLLDQMFYSHDLGFDTGVGFDELFVGSDGSSALNIGI
ncbi:hypothetical protein M409DRAFT_20907 [Zasmidium cellare ATCC 36951]|uniref:Xylanolytic transcriptional activator regulatory domain-containing protein n=1 Tax=Zasmidium cellare ATCC 36951 TaxID=1080233 RepID=A0A6A6CQD4_ZASCE|nr:uncharacterized protein M409DRAFT_20907 [Zasmidium cellare ATCC 36951]KAF2168893.1 hypothetical protein M409DRAFT_20907 [Zasmidium cellare ATCC 36951]